MSDTPGPRAVVALDPERPLGDRALVEHRVHVADQQDVRSAGPAETADHEVAELWLAVVGGLMRAALDLPSAVRGTAPRTGRRSRSRPAGEYEPQSTFTIAPSASTKSS